MIFKKNSIHNIKYLNIHDAEVSKVICNYDEHKVEIPIKFCREKEQKGVLIFEGVRYTDISFYEPWGAGIYVSEININDDIEIINRLDRYKISNDCFILSILLNSGDKINILSEKIIYLEG